MFASPRGTKVAGTAMAWGVIIIFGCGGGAGQAVPPVTPPVTGTCTSTPVSTLKVSVKDPPYNAKGDGVTDDTAAIQQAVNAVVGTGGTVKIPIGTYMVNPVANSNAGIRLGNNMTLSLDSGAILQALPTSTSNYCVLLLSGVHNVNIIGGTIIGNRSNNTITDTDENGMGIQAANSQHVVVDSVTSRDCWCDGFYVSDGSQDVTLCSVMADHNRRNGMSIVNVDGMVVRGSTFTNSTGMIESGAWVSGNGIDIEPNVGETVNNVQFLGCTFSSNASEGLTVGPSIANTGQAFVTNVVIDGNSAMGNGTYAGGAGIEISNTSGHQVINNVVSNSIGDGIFLRNGANNNLVTGNTVTGTTAAPPGGDIGYGILLYQTGGNTVTGNTVMNSSACGIRDAYPTGVNTINSNTFSNNSSNTCQ